MNNLTSREFDLLLLKTYPNFCVDMHGDPKKTCMAFGVSIPASWREIVFNGSAELEAIILSIPEEAERKKFKASQIKEKFGTLRVYIHAVYPSIYADQMQDVISKMENEVSKLPKDNSHRINAIEQFFQDKED